MNDQKAIPGEILLPVDNVIELLPMGKSTWLAGVKSGKFPQPIRLSVRRPVWRKSDIERLITSY